MATLQKQPDFLSFVRDNWSLVSDELFVEEPVGNFCNALERLVYMPQLPLFSELEPRTGKTKISTMLLPLWTWFNQGKINTRFICMYQNMNIRDRNLRDFRKVLDHLDIAYGKGNDGFILEQGGSWHGLSIHRTSGYQADFLILDDVMNMDKFSSHTERKRYKEGFKSGAMCTILPGGGLAIVETGPGMIDVLTEKEDTSGDPVEAETGEKL